MSAYNQPEDRIRLFLVDDETMVRAAFRSLLARDSRFEVVGDSGDAREAVEAISTLRPEIVLLDISMPGLSGIDAIAKIRRALPSARIIMLTHQEGEQFVMQAMQAGASGYLSKDSESTELVLAIEAVRNGNRYLSPKVSGAMIDRALAASAIEQTAGKGALSALTTREREVFQLLAIGRSNKEVARELGMSLGTAKKHRENLQRKLDCHSPAELARIAIREGLLDS